MRIGRVGYCALWAVVALSASGVSAQELVSGSEPNVPPRTAPAQLKQIDAQRHLLLESMMADPANLDIAFDYASLSAEAGDLEGAISTLERMLIFAPGLPRLHLELGVLYYRLGAYESALSYFDAALAAPDTPPEVRTKVETYIAAIGKRTAPSGFEGWMTVGARYQSNANGAPSSPLVNLNGLDFLLSDGATSAPDVNAFAAGNFLYSLDLASQGDRLVAALQTYGALYRETGELNTGVAEVTVGPEFNLQRFHIEDATLAIYGIANGVVLDSDAYLFSGGVGAILEKGLGARTRVGLQTEYRHEQYQDTAQRPTASLRTGNTVQASANVQFQLSENLSVFAVLLGVRRNAEAGYQSLWQIGSTIGGTLAFRSPFPQQSDPWAFTLSVAYLQRNHDDPDPMINFSQAEVEHEAVINGILSVPLQDNWSVQTAAGYRVVMSNYDLSDSTNLSGSIGLTKKF